MLPPSNGQCCCCWLLNFMSRKISIHSKPNTDNTWIFSRFEMKIRFYSPHDWVRFGSYNCQRFKLSRDGLQFKVLFHFLFPSRPDLLAKRCQRFTLWGWHRKFMKLLDNQTSPFLFKNIRPSAPITPKEPYAVGPLKSSHILYYYISTICFKTLLLVTVIIVSPLHLDYISIASYSNHISITSFFIPLVLVSIYKCNAIWSTAVHWGLSALSADLYYNFPFNSTFPPTPLSIILTSFCNVSQT